MDRVRVRLRFEDGDILSESQKQEGLSRCWLLLPPQLNSISDLSSYLVHKFSLQDSCLNGLLLYMDGFVLPSFESMSIFKDKDLIRIRRKGGDGATRIEESQIVEKQPLLTGVKLLAIEGSEKKETQNEDEEPSEDALPLETQNEHEEPSEDALHLENLSRGKVRMNKKRKYSDDLHSPKGLIDYCLSLAHTSNKRKKARSAVLKEQPMVTDEGNKKDAQMRLQRKIHGKGCLSQKRLNKKHKSSNKNSDSDVIISTDEAKNIDSTPIDKGDQLQVTGQDNVETSNMLNGTKKFPSRSARRKKAKRKWLRELANSQKQELIQDQMLEKDTHETPPEHQSPDQNTDIEEEVVPVEIRPGHIRFEPLGKEQSNLKSKDPVETFQWSGTTSKKKGQKWGIEKSPVCRRNGDDSSDKNFNEKLNVKDSNMVDAPVDFEKLVSLSGKPKEGDTIAYRLVELSSSWCPEISSFRVGKVSSYDPLSGKVLLEPVPEYPMALDEKKDEPIELLSSNSLYNEDGTLEIDFASLVDVRIINRNEADPMTVIANECREVPVNSQDAPVDKGLNHNAEATPSQVTESGDQAMTVWDDISHALSKKKAQLLQNNSFGAKDGSARGAWSYRALRSSALGPTMAMLRSQNGM